ncbi:MAG: PIN domain-containing protein [Terriglobales bacterium]
MSRIYWDTMLFVYWIEENPRYIGRIHRLLEKMKLRGDRLHTSSFAVGETLTGFYKSGSFEIARKVREILQPPTVEVISYTLEAADLYAQIRAKGGVSTPDAVHLACAAHAGIDLFLTNDNKLIGKVIPGIQFIAGIDSNIL